MKKGERWLAVGLENAELHGGDIRDFWRTYKMSNLVASTREDRMLVSKVEVKKMVATIVGLKSHIKSNFH